MLKIPVGLKLPKFWNMYSKIPYSRKYENEYKDVVYAIAFFEKKRALLFRRDYTILGNTETRRAKILIEEAIENMWIEQIFVNARLGDRPEGYPKEAKTLYWINVP